MANIFDKINSTIISSNPYWKYKLDNYVMPSGKISEYHYVETLGSTLIIPKLSDDVFLLSEQFRYLNQKMSIEFPGGGLAPGLTYEENALKELEEESGYKAGRLEYLGEFNPFNGVTNEICKVFLATNLQFVKPNPEESESFSYLKLNSNEINQMIFSNKIWDGMSISAWLIYLLKNKKNI